MTTKSRFIAAAAAVVIMGNMTGCGIRNIDAKSSAGTQSGQGDTQQSSQSIEDMQKEIDSLKQQIAELEKGSQGQEGTSGDSQPGQNTGESSNVQAEGSHAEKGRENSSPGTADSQSASQGSTAQAGENSQQVKLSLEEAKKIALDRVPGATDQNIIIKLDFDDGWYIYEGDIIYDRVEYEFEIDANTGALIEWSEERI